MFDWKRNKDKKARKGNQTPGHTKVERCQSNVLRKYMASRSRSYKHPEYPTWYLKTKRWN